MKIKKRQEKQNKYEEQIFFLYDLINYFTVKSNLSSKFYYFTINWEIANKNNLQGFLYSPKGLSKNKEFFQSYKNETKISKKAKYLATLARLLSFIFEKVSKNIGEDKAKKNLSKSYKSVSKKYNNEPDLEGYVPLEITGKAAAAAAAAALDVSLTEQMLNYMINQVKSEEVIQKTAKLKMVDLEIEKIYRDKLGPLGLAQYEKIGKSTNYRDIAIQISQLEKEKVISKKQKEEFLEEVKIALGQNSNSLNFDLFGEGKNKKEVMEI